MAKLTKKPRAAKPSKQKFKPAYALSTQTLIHQVHAERVKMIAIRQEPDGSYWLAARLADLPQTFFLATKREATAPRRFVRLDVVVAFLKRKINYSGSIELQLAQTEEVDPPKYKGRALLKS